MTNLTEKLELMAWLYGQGIEPDMWYREHDGDHYWFTGSELMTKDAKPWLPLEQILRILPPYANEIHCSDPEIMHVRFYCNGYRCGFEQVYNSSLEPEQEPIMYELARGGIHLAALKLLKMVKELQAQAKGYIPDNS